ncbi:hypothetical protein C8J56DRAFT_91445 [Mycena floridula]|nr:hypothetical protein C8J56DRAFT_91445 [Mycena floridula]
MPTTAGILPHEFQHQQSTRNSVCREPPLPPPGPVKVAPETSSPIPPEPTTTTLPFRLMSIESSPNVDDSNIIFILKAFYIFTAQDVPIPLLEKGLTLSEWRQLYFTSMSDGSTSLTSQNAELVTVHATEPSAFRPEPPNGATEPPKQEANVAFNCIKQWNREIFAAKGLQAVICRTIESPLEYAVYIIDAGKTETISEGQEMIVEGLGNDGRK